MTSLLRLFIGSSKEQLHLADAIQEVLEHDFQTTVWSQGIFAPSSYALESLEDRLDQSDAAIFVLAPDDFVHLRGENYTIPRDNVIFELGMFVGRLGRQRSFIIIPRGLKNLRLPTDLMGLVPAEYQPDRRDANHVAALGPACTRIRRVLHGLVKQRKIGRRFSPKALLFPDVMSLFPELINSAKEITTYFVHSRRWRENHHDELKEFLNRQSTKMTVFLPDLASAPLVEMLRLHFDDGPYVPGFVGDAYRYYASFAKTFPKKVIIYLFKTYPTYSFYKFDRKIVYALYPLSTLRTAVPTFVSEHDGQFDEFFTRDLTELIAESRKATLAELEQLARPFVSSPRLAAVKKSKSRAKG